MIQLSKTVGVMVENSRESFDAYVTITMTHNNNSKEFELFFKGSNCDTSDMIPMFHHLVEDISQEFEIDESLVYHCDLRYELDNWLRQQGFQWTEYEPDYDKGDYDEY